MTTADGNSVAKEQALSAAALPTSWWRRWSVVVGVSLIGVAPAIVLAVGGNLLMHPFLYGNPITDWATALWIASAVSIAAPFGAVPGPAHRIRVWVAVVAGVCWFAVGRIYLA